MSIPNELVQGIVDIKTAIENKSADTPVVIPDREYPDELCEALGAVKDAIENSSGGGGEIFTDYDGTITFRNSSANTMYYSYPRKVGSAYAMFVGTINTTQTKTITDAALIDGKFYISVNKSKNSYNFNWSSGAESYEVIGDTTSMTGVFVPSGSSMSIYVA